MVGVTLIVIVGALLLIGWWWRHYSLACPAGASWLLENPYMLAVAGPDKLFARMGLEPGMRLLDVGAGPGRIAIPAAVRVGPEGEVVALDIQQKMLDKLQAKADRRGVTNLRTVHAAAGSGEVEQEYFDRAILVTVLGEIPDKGAALAEIFSALRSGGVLSVTELIPDPHYQSRRRVVELGRAAGFIEQGYLGNPLAYTLNLKKP
jgi:ubiquinone/menaquinone biosynthesis C-methylase UbiE